MLWAARELTTPPPVRHSIEEGGGGRYTGPPLLLVFWAFQLTNVTFWNMYEVLKIYSFCMRGDTI